jgi:toxin ParE1/3/4
VIDRFYSLTPQAEADILEIWDYIADDSEDRADEVISKLRKAFVQLGRNPGLGHRRPLLAGRRHRFWTVYSYVIVYLCEREPIQIVAVVHGARQIETVLASREETSLE